MILTMLATLASCGDEVRLTTTKCRLIHDGKVSNHDQEIEWTITPDTCILRKGPIITYEHRKYISYDEEKGEVTFKLKPQQGGYIIRYSK